MLLRNNIKSYTLGLMLCFVVLISQESGAYAQTAAAAPATRIAVEGIFPPFNYLDSNQQLQGFDVDMAKALRCSTTELRTCRARVGRHDS